MTNLIPFSYQNKEVRTVVKDGDPWFVAKDVCEILELGNVPMAVGRLSDSMKGVNSVDTLGGKQDLWCISETGLYKLVFTSRKPEAEKFTDWVASEVLPSIRKHGAYVTDELLNDPDLAIKAFTALKEGFVIGAVASGIYSMGKAAMSKTDIIEALPPAPNVTYNNITAKETEQKISGL